MQCVWGREGKGSIRRIFSAAASPHRRASRVPLSRMPGCIVCGGGGGGQHHAHILKGILEIFKDTFAQDG